MLAIRNIEIIAHRGLHETARENTLDAFERAINAGANSIELDVHSTADGAVVVHHDPGIPALGGEAVSIATATFGQAKVAARTAGFELPTLSEALEQCSGRAKVYIEVKATGIELMVARIIRESPCELAVHAFDHRVAKTMRDFVPGLQTGLLIVSRPVDPVQLLKSANAQDYWPQVDFADQELVEEVHEFGGRIIVWTANNPDQWERLLKIGVDGICTDRPDLLAVWRLYLTETPERISY